jgi:hypothetical protein
MRSAVASEARHRFGIGGRAKVSQLVHSIEWQESVGVYFF